MRKRTFRAWDAANNRMLYDIETMPNFADIWNSDNFVKMEGLNRADQNGKRIYELDYAQQTQRIIKTTFEYEISQVLYVEEQNRYGLKPLKSRKLFHDKWENDRKEEFVRTLSSWSFSKKTVIGNPYESPTAVDNFRPDYDSVLEKTPFEDAGGKAIIRYSVLKFENRVPGFKSYSNILVADNSDRDGNGFWFLRPFNNPWHNEFINNKLTPEIASMCKIIDNAFSDNFDHKARGLYTHTA